MPAGGSRRFRYPIPPSQITNGRTETMTLHRRCYAAALPPPARALLLAATLALAGASAARAQVVYADIPDVTIRSSSADSTFDIDLDGDGAADLRFGRQSGSIEAEAGEASILGFGIGPVGDQGGVLGELKEEAYEIPFLPDADFQFPAATALPPNEVIASGAQVDTAALCIRVTAALGPQVFGDEPWREGGAFLGFSVGLSGNLHYGWARLRANAACTEATLEEYAYEATPGEPILAGNTGAGALPVELVAFEARADGDAVALEWATASETGNAGFAVEHEVGGAFRRVGFVDGAGTTTEARRYTHAVGGLPPGLHRFRLRQLDLGGAFAFSPEVEVRLGVPGTHALSAPYPNPFNLRTRFTLSVARRQRVEVAVHDALGRRVARLYEGVVDAGAPRTFEVEGHAWPSGVYLIRVRGEAFAEARRVTLVK